MNSSTLSAPTSHEGSSTDPASCSKFRPGKCRPGASSTPSSSPECLHYRIRAIVEDNKDNVNVVSSRRPRRLDRVQRRTIADKAGHRAWHGSRWPRAETLEQNDGLREKAIWRRPGPPAREPPAMRPIRPLDPTLPLTAPFVWCTTAPSNAHNRATPNDSDPGGRPPCVRKPHASAAARVSS
jgi:hypothetical protein